MTIDETYEFTGPQEPATEDVVEGCEISLPIWGEHVYTIDDLPLRYVDTTPPGGTAQNFYLDGQSTAGWDQITPDTIRSWLEATDF